MTGGTISYAITIFNAGPDSAAAVLLTDTLDATTTFISFTQNTGPSFPAVNTPAVGATGAVTAGGATLPLGGSATFTLVVRVPGGAGGQITNTAQVASAATDPNSANNVSRSRPRSVQHLMSSSRNQTALIRYTGRTVCAYTLTLSNYGPVAATNVVLDD